MSELISARKFRSNLEVVVEIRPGEHVRARREDMTLLVFEGRLPMPLLAAVQRMVDMPAGASDADRLAELGAEAGATLAQVLREHAVRVVIEPKLVLEDTGNPDELPVSYLSTAELTAIWSATALVPMVTAASAGRFRGRAVVDDVDAAPNGADVPPVAERVADSEVDVVTG